VDSRTSRSSAGPRWTRPKSTYRCSRSPSHDRWSTSTIPAVRNAGWVNDQLAAVVGTHPDRFRGFAALPLQDPAAVAAELRRCVEELGFCGALVNDCATAWNLDRPGFDVVWSTVASLGLPLYLHPGSPPADRWDVLTEHAELTGALWSWGAETAGRALRILFGGVFDRHPEATLMLGHMGEFLPYQRSRLDSRWMIVASERTLERAPSDYIGTNIVSPTPACSPPLR
jgi:2,3-dihydroxybenzoate decarboxylase